MVKDAQTINQALGYEMNTIEFAIQDGVPYAIDFLNPAPDFERDRITEFYFEQVVDKMARLVIDRALSGKASNSWPRWEEMLGDGREQSELKARRVSPARQNPELRKMAVGQTNTRPEQPGAAISGARTPLLLPSRQRKTK